jgi:amidase
MEGHELAALESVVRVSRENSSKGFDPSRTPVAYAHPGDQMVVETHCCSAGTVTQSISTASETFYSDLGYSRGMPLTGPIAVPVAEVGDILAVEVLNIELADQGWTMALQDHGVIGDRIKTGESRIIPIESGSFVFQDRVRLPIRPMIGAIGTTPAEGPVGAGPDFYGGNMDCKLIGAGSTVYLPVLIPGANLALGDVHAVQGDGEVGSAGIEIGSQVTLRLRLLRGLELPLPFLETSDLIATIYTAEELKEAAVGAIERMANFLVVQADLSLADAWMLLSLVGDVRICQLVNPVMTCRMEVPKTVLAKLGVDLAALWHRWAVDTGRASK